jgi:hypothetical protein
MKLHLRQAKLNHGRVAYERPTSILREQRQRLGTARILIEHLDRLAPRRSLRGVDLAEIKNPRRVPIGNAATL